jgi:hypothetical protein
MNAYATFIKNRKEIERDLRSVLARHGFRLAGQLANPLTEDGIDLDLVLRPLNSPQAAEAKR